MYNINTKIFVGYHTEGNKRVPDGYLDIYLGKTIVNNVAKADLVKVTCDYTEGE